MTNEELQQRPEVLFWLIDNDWVQFTKDVPQTVEGLRAVRRGPDGKFDLTTVHPLVRALCNMLDIIASSLPKEVLQGEDIGLPPVELPPVQRERASDDDFMQDLVQAANLVRKYLMLAAAAVPLRPLEKRQRAVLVGNMVRLARLCDLSVFLVVELRGEQALLLLRPLVETAINLKFFARKGSPGAYEAYIKASLAYEKKLWEEIEKRKHVPPLAIEQRMPQSIERLFKDSGYRLDEVSWDDRHWRDAFALADDVDASGIYTFAFAPSSHAIHGTWSDLMMHHVEQEGDTYLPELRFTAPKPALLEGASGIALEAAADCLDVVLGLSAREMNERLAQLRRWFVDMGREHERWRG